MKPSSIKKLSVLILAIALLPGACSKKGKPGDEIQDPVQKKYLRWLQMKEKAVPELKAALKSPVWRERTHALLAMGQSGDASLIPLIFTRLKEDESMPVRNCAVIALGDLKAREAVPYLITLINRKKPVPRGLAASPKLVIQALGKIKDQRGARSLSALLISKNSSLQSAASKSLAAIGAPSVSRWILSHQGQLKKSGGARYAAVVIAARPVPGAAPYLIRLLNGKDIQARVAAAKALGTIKSRKGTLHLIRALTADVRLLQKQAAESLIIINNPGAIHPLIALFHARAESTIMSAAYVLANMRVKGIVPPVFSLFQRDHSVNMPAAYLLGRKKYKKAAPLIRKRLANPHEKGQTELAEALGWIGDHDAVPLLMKVAARKSLTGSTGAIWSLGQLKAREAVPLLLKLMDRDDQRLTPYIIASLGSIGDPRAVKPLIEYFYETGSRYARPIGASIGKIGGDEAVTFVKDNIDSGEKAQVMAAGSALIKLKDKSLIPYGMSLLDSKDKKVRGYAALFLHRVTGKTFSRPEEWKEWALKNR